MSTAPAFVQILGPDGDEDMVQASDEMRTTFDRLAAIWELSPYQVRVGAPGAMSTVLSPDVYPPGWTFDDEWAEHDHPDDLYFWLE